jgi:hypothetical protein
MMEVFHEFFSGHCSKIAQLLGQLNFEDHNAQRKLRLKLEGLKITSPGRSMDLTAICEAKTTLKSKSRSVQLSLGSYPHLPQATVIYADLSLGALLGTRKPRQTLRVVA